MLVLVLLAVIVGLLGMYALAAPRPALRPLRVTDPLAERRRRLEAARQASRRA